MIQRVNMITVTTKPHIKTEEEGHWDLYWCELNTDIKSYVRSVASNIDPLKKVCLSTLSTPPAPQLRGQRFLYLRVCERFSVNKVL